MDFGKVDSLMRHDSLCFGSDCKSTCPSQQKLILSCLHCFKPSESKANFGSFVPDFEFSSATETKNYSSNESLLHAIDLEIKRNDHHNGGSRLQLDCSYTPYEILISDIKDFELYSDHGCNRDLEFDLDENLKKDFQKFLEVGGIKSSIVAFMFKCVNKKETQRKLKIMDPNQQPYFPDGLNMLNDEFDILEPTHTQTRPSGSAVTPTSHPRKLTSDVCQCFNIVQMTLPNGTSGPRAKFVHVGLKQVSDQIDRIRDAISWICSSNPRFSEFKRHCKLNGLKPQRFQTDMPVRWNSTYLMLENCLEYDTTITCFYNMKLAKTGQHSPKILTTDDWYVAKIFVEFLKIFYNATVTLFGVYYPTSSPAIHQIVEISELLNSYREDEHLGVVVVAMETKLKKYWANIPLLYALSAIVDPRVKLSGLEVFLEFIDNNLSIDYSEQITDI
ncbi:hypothetical protein Ddye_032180 [Dipteronia dyeriana]|uniref:hAT-like transposase RNase-H fold domain-containing protein n=1 Tax=Dipteronia dyeriana TaxID=168575 RepID=A0AAD9TKR5_9ROSI|nr:hypothetical protein Ddye_032180 [Dipteronia dyeriana]